MSEWLIEARDAAEEHNYKTARRLLEKAPGGSTAEHEAAAALADRIAAGVDGRRKRQFEEISSYHRLSIKQIQEEAQRQAEGRLRQRIVNNVFLFAVMSALEEEPSAIEWWRQAAPRVTAWAGPLKVPFDIGYDAVKSLGPVRGGEAERREVRQLRTEVVNNVVIAHLQVFDDVKALRNAVPACFGYALVKDDGRAKQLVARMQQLTGSVMQLPSEAASGTIFLDALERADVARTERGYFRSASTAAFNVGIGAAVEDSF